MTIPIKTRNEKRHYRRQNLYAHALVEQDGTVFSGEIINISNMGAYITTNAPFAIGSSIDLKIYFNHDTRKLSMTVPCTVARIDGKGFGLASSHIETNMLLRLELIFDLHKEDTKQLIEELCKTI